jgi:hypothetical protein
MQVPIFPPVMGDVHYLNSLWYVKQILSFIMDNTAFITS